ncbi:hypothetical protein Ntsu_01000 [Nocardia sp. IFM 10818]
MVRAMTIAVASADAARTRVRVSPRDPIPRTLPSLNGPPNFACASLLLGSRLPKTIPLREGFQRIGFSTSVPTNGTSAAGTQTDPSAC